MDAPASLSHHRPALDELAVNQIPDELDPQQAAYDPFREPEQYRAFRDGWYAQQQQRPPAPVPYPLSQFKLALAWLDGWTAARQGSPDRRAAAA